MIPIPYGLVRYVDYNYYSNLITGNINQKTPGFNLPIS